MAGRLNTIFLVFRDRLFREALQALISPWPDYSVAGKAETVNEAREALAAQSADIVLLDIDIAAEPGFSLLQDLAEAGRAEQAVVLTRELHAEYIREALRLGARGFLSHAIGPEQLRDALLAIRKGRTVIDPLACKALADGPVRDRVSDRECQVLTLIAEGACNAAIAERLGITEKTVKSHVSSLLDKLGMSSRVHLAVYAKDTSLLEPSLAGDCPSRTD